MRPQPTGGRFAGDQLGYIADRTARRFQQRARSANTAMTSSTQQACLMGDNGAGAERL